VPTLLWSRRPPCRNIMGDHRRRCFSARSRDGVDQTDGPAIWQLADRGALGENKRAVEMTAAKRANEESGTDGESRGSSRSDPQAGQRPVSRSVARSSLAAAVRERHHFAIVSGHPCNLIRLVPALAEAEPLFPKANLPLASQRHWHRIWETPQRRQGPVWLKTLASSPNWASHPSSPQSMEQCPAIFIRSSARRSCHCCQRHSSLTPRTAAVAARRYS
jgi:hypothetical protein